MPHLINFDAGPATLYREVLEEASRSILDYKGTGLSILEIAHRGPLFRKILEESKALVLELLGLDESYEVLWLQGGGRMQFSMVPMNFLPDTAEAGYVESGHWAAEALKAAKRYGNAKAVASSRASGFDHIPDWGHPDPKMAYLHLTTNNTIYGTQFFSFPDTEVPLVVDMSSEIFSRKIDYSRFSLIYAVAQKNMGPAGVTLVVVRKSLLKKEARDLPEILSYKSLAHHGSLLNTPPVFAIYCCMLTLRKVREIGLEQIEKESHSKAALLYEAIDASRRFYAPAQPTSRSLMNVCFHMYDKEREASFLGFCEERDIVGIKGHRSVGGFRASLYNAITLEDVKRLVAALVAFDASPEP